MWASAPTEVCCGRHRPAKMLRRGGACPRPRAAIKAAPTSGVPSSAGYLAALGRRGGCPHPPGAGRWPGGAGRCGHRPLQRSAAAGTARPKCSVGAGLVPTRGQPQGPPLLPVFCLQRAILRRLDVGAGRCGHRPLQRSAAAGTARPKCSVGAGLVPARGRPQGPPLLPGFRRWRAILRCSKHVGAGAHTRPQAVRQDKAPASGGTPCAGVLLSPEEVIRMANYTQHYHLHQWEPEDSVARQEI